MTRRKRNPFARAPSTSTRTLTYPAPAREPVELPNGQFYTRPWTFVGVQEALAGGAFFEPTARHEFAPHTGAKSLAMKHWSRLPRDQFGRIKR